ncbi:MAG TPA: serine/threonine-protein kinase, partial [Chthoniobacterales bacterium]
MANGVSTAPRGKIDPARWDRLKSILEEALRQTARRARAAIVRKHCGNDLVLLREAESLLAAAEALNEEPADWLEGGAEQATATFWDDDLSRDGQRIGAYVVVRQLGRGGMGAVYLAARADGEFEKEVAIKVLKRGTDTDEILRRFRTERRIVARLDHPNIARLLDAGTTDDGLPYFVMEYVAGVPVTRFVREQNLTIPERLELFLKICGAVEVAHKAAVVHRDLKPGNILITATGEPKLLDFGIAKLLAAGEGSDDYTVAGRQPMTPHSASPEQLRGDSVTVASDVYALGALLYEMLTARKPYRFSTAQPSREEVLRVLCDDAITSPSRAVAAPGVRRQLQGDLDNIVLRAMRIEPSERYPSVAEFAADVRSHLAGGLV